MKYRFHWLGSDRKVEEGEGTSPADALNKLGYGGGAVAALDYWEEVVEGAEGAVADIIAEQEMKSPEDIEVIKPAAEIPTVVDQEKVDQLQIAALAADKILNDLHESMPAKMNADFLAALEEATKNSCEAWEAYRKAADPEPDISDNEAKDDAAYARICSLHETALKVLDDAQKEYDKVVDIYLAGRDKYEASLKAYKPIEKLYFCWRCRRRELNAVL